MAYNAKQGGFGSKPTPGVLTSATNIFTHIAIQSLIVRRLAFEITTAVVSTGNVVLTFYKRPTPGSSSGQTTIGTISIPTLAAVPNVYWKDVAGVKFQPGEEFACDVTTASAGGGAAGAGFPVHEEVEESPEEVANFSNHIASS